LANASRDINPAAPKVKYDLFIIKTSSHH